MKRALLLLALCAAPAFGAEVGFATAEVPDPGGQSMEVGIWYPTQAAGSDERLGLYTQHVAPRAPIAGTGHPLVVMSHGNGGSLENHYDTALALAQAGFVVAAMMHPGDNYKDQSRATDLAARPRAVHAVIDYMLATWPQHAAVAPVKIGVFGFSSGGFTALVAIGGIPDLSAVAPYCVTHPQAFVCTVMREHPATGRIAATDWLADPRIKAAVVVAPAIGFVFKNGLAAVYIPVQLWRGGEDHILPSPDYVEPVRDALQPPPEYHVAEGADHFDFLAPCSTVLASIAPMICQAHAGFDRTAFHQTFNAEIVSFFQRTLQ